ncbi:hypothetical protein HYALB_00006105 [Hymenoscyphus albidus]|uniref:Uncharacterized protein n=1 Tax=Hymenoscyphus albidus TaxID=595503 RepID=A0A9N9M2T9_9HELO|nr:hypothetical protein HYALB_00006105 [Hymenoscyphus albidus]
MEGPKKDEFSGAIAEKQPSSLQFKSGEFVSTHEKWEKHTYIVTRHGARQKRYVWFDPETTLLFDDIGQLQTGDNFWEWYPGMKPDQGFRASEIRSLAFRGLMSWSATVDFTAATQFLKTSASSVLVNFFNLRRLVFCKPYWMIKKRFSEDFQDYFRWLQEEAKRILKAEIAEKIRRIKQDFGESPNIAAWWDDPVIDFVHRRDFRAEFGPGYSPLVSFPSVNKAYFITPIAKRLRIRVFCQFDKLLMDLQRMVWEACIGTYLTVRISTRKYDERLFDYEEEYARKKEFRQLLFLKPHPALHICKLSKKVAMDKEWEKTRYIKYDTITSPLYENPLIRNFWWNKSITLRFDSPDQLSKFDFAFADSYSSVNKAERLFKATKVTSIAIKCDGLEKVLKRSPGNFNPRPFSLSAMIQSIGKYFSLNRLIIIADCQSKDCRFTNLLDGCQKLTSGGKIQSSKL